MWTTTSSTRILLFLMLLLALISSASDVRIDTAAFGALALLCVGMLRAYSSMHSFLAFVAPIGDTQLSGQPGSLLFCLVGAFLIAGAFFDGPAYRACCTAIAVDYGGRHPVLGPGKKVDGGYDLVVARSI